jgi:hypothetical protein
MAGFAAAIISQPADTMLSKINKTKGLPGEGTMSRLIKIGGELGLRGSFSGLGARLFMVGTLVCIALFGTLCSVHISLTMKSYRLLVSSPSMETSSASLVPPEEWKSENKGHN